MEVECCPTVIPCKFPGLSCCPDRLVATGRPDDNVVRCQIWCMNWKGSKNGNISYGCDQIED
jgi:hypothetical protein